MIMVQQEAHCVHCGDMVYEEYVEDGRRYIIDVWVSHRCEAMREVHSYEWDGQSYFLGCSCVLG